ncbi:OmpA family protein [Gemmobacter denitrificans]|uniref:OmpA family protein n=1 Tax=Gemmobacter denitrificans TaxID=3123040 RepID=A0ABU8BTM1_9RHOB
MKTLVGLLLILASPVQAQDLKFPAPVAETSRLETPSQTLRLPVGAWRDGADLPQRIGNGTVTQITWRVEGPVATLDLMAHLRAQVLADGWTEVFSCETSACGGFDFRYALPVQTEPEMHVDLGDFRYLLAEKGDGLLMLLVSRSRQSGHVQLTRLDGANAAPPPVNATADPGPDTGTTATTIAPPPGDLAARLEGQGAVVLEDLVFASGADALAPGDYASLAALVAYLSARPDAKVALIGHTDASGALAGNVALSEARARSVRKALIALGADASRIDAQGVGWLAPRASNLTAEGRTRNRRVEVMLTSTQLAAP